MDPETSHSLFTKLTIADTCPDHMKPYYQIIASAINDHAEKNNLPFFSSKFASLVLNLHHNSDKTLRQAIEAYKRDGTLIEYESDICEIIDNISNIYFKEHPLERSRVQNILDGTTESLKNNIICEAK